MGLRRLQCLGPGTPDLRAYLRSLQRQRPPARPGFALAAGLATLIAIFAL